MFTNGKNAAEKDARVMETVTAPSALKELKFTVRSAPVRVEMSKDDAFHFEYDSDAVTVTQTSDETTAEITVTGKPGFKRESHGSVRVCIPDLVYEAVTGTVDSGVFHIAIPNADLHFACHSGVFELMLPPCFTKTIQFTGHSTTVKFDMNGNADFSFQGKMNSCVLSAPKEWPGSHMVGSANHSFTIGNGTAKINMDLKNAVVKIHK